MGEVAGTVTLTHGSLFSGVGGFDLGFERAGMETRWQVENNLYCQEVLKQNFRANIYGDINECFPESTSSVEDSLVRMLAQPVNAPDLPEPVRDSGGQWCVPFAWYDPSTSLWRTWQRCFAPSDQKGSSSLLQWAPFLETWPRAGMTRNGIAYQRQPSVPLTSATESSSSVIWPTPKSSPSGPDYARTNRKGSGGDDLATAVARQIFPTPKSRDWKGQSQRGIHRQGDALPNLDRGDGTVIGGQLNPTWVEWLMGFPLEWTALKRSVTRSSRKSRSTSAVKS